MATYRATIVLGTVSLLGASAMAFAQSAEPTGSAKRVKDRPATAAQATADKPAETGVTTQKKLSLCLETWDAQTHMTKKEWRIACARSVRDYPDAFER
jgi:hypothetical protein